jgi:hypothetical protein
MVYIVLLPSYSYVHLPYKLAVTSIQDLISVKRRGKRHAICNFPRFSFSLYIRMRSPLVRVMVRGPGSGGLIRAGVPWRFWPLDPSASPSLETPHTNMRILAPCPAHSPHHMYSLNTLVVGAVRVSVHADCSRPRDIRSQGPLMEGLCRIWSIGDFCCCTSNHRCRPFSLQVSSDPTRGLV